MRTRRAATETKRFIRSLPDDKPISKEKLLEIYKEYRRHGTHQEQDIPASFMPTVNAARRRSVLRRAVVYMKGDKCVALPVETYMSWRKCIDTATKARLGKTVETGKPRKCRSWVQTLSKAERHALASKAAKARWAAEKKKA